MALSEIDRNLLDRCLGRKPRSWEDFVDRFVGLVMHVIGHTAQARSVRLTKDDREDLAADVFLAIVRDDFAVLRHFRQQSSLATYLAVVARRVVVRELLKRKVQPAPLLRADEIADDTVVEPVERIGDREEVERLLDDLSEQEAEAVRQYHLGGKTYGEISAALGIAENSIGPLLSRARARMRAAGVDTAGS